MRSTVQVEHLLVKSEERAPTEHTPSVFTHPFLQRLFEKLIVLSKMLVLHLDCGKLFLEIDNLHT